MLNRSTEQLPQGSRRHASQPPSPARALEFTCIVELGKALCNTGVFGTQFSNSACISYCPTIGEPGRRLFAFTQVDIQLELVTLAPFPEAFHPVDQWKTPQRPWKRVSENFLENVNFSTCRSPTAGGVQALRMDNALLVLRPWVIMGGESGTGVFRQFTVSLDLRLAHSLSLGL